MTIRELKEILDTYDENMTVVVLDTYLENEGGYGVDPYSDDFDFGTNRKGTRLIISP